MTSTGGKPGVLLLGEIHLAKQEWQELDSIAELKQLNTGDRAQFIKDCDKGTYDGVVAIFRTFPSVANTGRIDKELVAHLPSSLKSISHNGAGYDQIDVEACTARSISVSNTPKVVDAATASMGMYLILGCLHRSWIPMKALREGRWDGKAALGHDPNGKVLGILGMGGIGTALAKRAAAFDMKIQYHNRKPIPAENQIPGVDAKYVSSLDELLKTSDVISVHLPLSEKTRHFIGAREIAMMKDGAIVINTARGLIIDEAALAAALDAGKLYSVGLDVFENEPEIHPDLLKNENVVLTPHIGTATIETRKAMEVLTIENVKASVREGRLVTQVPEQRSK